MISCHECSTYELYRGLQAKSRQNAQAYQRRKAATTLQTQATILEDGLDPYNVPLHLATIAQQPLCSDSRLFREALRSADTVDESDLGVWSSRPPYKTLLAHREDEAEHNFTEKLVQVIDGKRLRELREDGERRIGLVKAKAFETVGKELEDDINQLSLICREDAPEAIASAMLPGSKRDLRMARSHYEWSARRLYCLCSDLLALRQSAVKYIDKHRRGELAWQTIPITPAPSVTSTTY